MKKIRILLLFLLFLLSMVCLALVFLPASWTVDGGPPGHSIRSVTVVRHYGALHIAALVLALIILAAAAVSIRIKTVPFRPALWIFPLVIFPAAFIINMFSNLAPWTCHGSVKAGSGAVYCFLDSSFLQGQLMSIARLRERTLFFDRFDVLATTNGDSPRRYLHIVRPSGSKEGYGQLYLSKDNRLVGVRSGNRMFLAYDLGAKRAFVREEVMTLSPFLLIGKDTGLLEADRRQLLDAGVGTEVGQPRLERVTEALRHGNPGVRALAGDLLTRRTR